MCIATEKNLLLLIKLYRFWIVYAFPPAKRLCTTLGRTVNGKNITILFGKVCIFKISWPSYYAVGEDVTSSTPFCPVPALHNNKFNSTLAFFSVFKDVQLAPSWLNSSSTVLVRRRNRSSKYDPVVQEANLIHATPQYAFVRFKNGH